MPSSPDLRAIRAHIAVNHRKLHRIVTAPSFRDAVGELDGEQLSRTPQGYLPDHPACRYLRFKQFLAGREFEADLAVRDRFYPQVLSIFRAVAPLARFLNAPLLAERRTVTQASILKNGAFRPDPQRNGRHPAVPTSTL